MEKENTAQSMIDGATGLIGKATVTAPVAAPVVEVPKGSAINPITVKSPLGDETYGGTPLASINLSTFADVQKFAKEFLGTEIKEVKDFVPLFTELKAAKEKAAVTDQLQQTLDTYTSNLNNLPKDITLLMNAALQGEDHLPILQKLQQKTVINYEKPFEAHDPVKLINHYTNKTYTKETFDALDETAKEALSDSVKMKFDADRNELLNFETNTKKATELRQEKFRSSVESSIATMLAGNPQMGKAAVDRVRQVMLYGIADVLFTKDKTYVPEAAEKIAMMEFGKQTIAAQRETIGDIVKRMTNESVSKANEQILLKSDKPPISTGPISNNLIASIVERETAFLRKR